MHAPMSNAESFYTRTEMMLGTESVERLKRAHVAVFGIGGVGGFATEALARAGIGALTLIDADTVSISNINRQIIATHSTLGINKAEAMRARISDINPDCRVTVIDTFYSEENADSIPLKNFDYVVDCIDSVKSKIHLICEAKKANVQIISSMGAGNKLDPTRFKVTDISKTVVDPLAKVIRVELRKRGINHLKVVFSDEEPINPERSRTPGSVSFVPSVVGLIMGGEVIKDLSKT